MLVERIRILSLAHFLLLLLDFECAQILLQRTLVYSVFVFGIFQLDLSLLLDHGLPVEILEEQMLQALAPDLDCDVVFLFEVLMLTILVAQLGFLVLFLLLGDQPEVVDSEALIIVLSCGDLFSLDAPL